MLTALLGNALKYSDAGQLLVTCGMSGDHIMITVEDEGPGINAKEADKIFDAFIAQTAAETMKRMAPGWGWPLSAQLSGRTAGV